MKSLLESFKNDLKQEINKVNERIEDLFKRVDAVDARNRALEDWCNRLQSQLDSRPIVSVPVFDDVLKEGEERHRRRKYIVISGVEEHESGSFEERRAKDAETVTRIAEQLQIANLEIKEISRIGKIDSSRPRLLRCKCKSVDERNSLLRKARLLRDSEHFKGVYVNADQTLLQRKANRELRNELRRRREEGEDVVINRGKIVPKSSFQNFI